MKHTPWLAFSIDRKSPTPVFEQICKAIRSKVISGELSEGIKLPPTRVFSTEMGVSRSTIVTAYEQLTAEGYLKSTKGSGYTVCIMGEVEFKEKSPTSEKLAQKEITSPPRAFHAGLPDMRLFPHRQWAKAVSRVCRSNPEKMLVGGTPFGNFELRKAIADHVSEWRGLEASPGQIIVTAGAADALEICIQTLANPGNQIGLEDPGYLPVRSLAESLGLKTVFMRVDEDGATLPSKSKELRLVVLTPSHQYPLGGAMSPSRRFEFIQWAEKVNGWIIEDDYDSEFRYAGRPIPAMAGFDQLKRTIYVGSFSKIFSNTLRLGYLIVPEATVEIFHARMSAFGLRASYMPQQALAEFMNNHEFYRHLRRVRRIYGERRKFLLECLSRDFSQYGSFIDHQAGMQIVFNLHPEMNDKKVSAMAYNQGLAVQPLSRFSVAQNGYNGLVLGYCGHNRDELSIALIELKTILDRVYTHSPH